MAERRIFSRREIEGLIANGETLVIYQNDVLRLNAWQQIHPGGRLVIQHMVGRDATDELSMFVSPSRSGSAAQRLVYRFNR